MQTDQRWGTATPITFRDKEFGAVRLRAYGIYSYHISDPKAFYAKVSGTRSIYRTAEIEGQLRNTIVGRMSDAFAGSELSFLDMAGNQVAMGQKIFDELTPTFAEIGLKLDSFVIETVSPGRTSENPGPADRNEHSGRHDSLHAIQCGPIHSHSCGK